MKSESTGAASVGSSPDLSITQYVLSYFYQPKSLTLMAHDSLLGSRSIEQISLLKTSITISGVMILRCYGVGLLMIKSVSSLIWLIMIFWTFSMFERPPVFTSSISAPSTASVNRH